MEHSTFGLRRLHSSKFRDEEKSYKTVITSSHHAASDELIIGHCYHVQESRRGRSFSSGERKRQRQSFRGCNRSGPGYDCYCGYNGNTPSRKSDGKNCSVVLCFRPVPFGRFRGGKPRWSRTAAVIFCDVDYHQFLAFCGYLFVDIFNIIAPLCTAVRPIQ